jgi:hypothetical protein
MKVNVRAAVALLAGLATAIPALQLAAQAPGQIPAGYAYYNFDEEMAKSVATDETAAASCDCGNSGCGGLCGGGSLSASLAGGGLAARSGQAFFGADYLNIRANFSDATTFVERNTATATDTFHQADFDYNSSYRLFGGYRFQDCCGEVLVAYNRYRSESTNTSDAATATRQFTGPFEVVSITPGSQVTTNIDVDAEFYDIDFARTLPLGSALGDCSCNWCPAWDIKWFFGGRYADIEWIRDSATTDANAQTLSSRTRMDFEGVGPRFGVDGRRYIGRNGNFSVFAKGGLSLLLGDVDYLTTSVTATPGVTPSQRARFTRVIPVTEIEVGASVHATDNFTISGGYLLSAWHDLGLGEQNFATLTTGFYDDANILAFDGWFVRGELLY